MRFLPFEAAAIDAEPTIRAAEAFCRRLQKILHYVYLFNTPGSDLLHTRCSKCGHVVLYREFYGPMGAKLKLPEDGLPDDNSCPACPHYLPIVGFAGSQGVPGRRFRRRLPPHPGHGNGRGHAHRHGGYADRCGGTRLGKSTRRGRIKPACTRLFSIPDPTSKPSGSWDARRMPATGPKTWPVIWRIDWRAWQPI